MNNFKIFDIPIDTINLGSAISELGSKRLKIFTPNPEILLESIRNPNYRIALLAGDLMLPDGHGLQLVSTLLQIKSKFLRVFLYLPALFLFLFWKKPFKKIFPEIIHGSDFMLVLVAWAELNNKSVFFLGANDDCAKKTAYYFKNMHPNLKIAGFSNIDPSEKAFELIETSHADILFVAYGAPKQELFVTKYFEKLPCLSIAMCVGGSFDFFSGNIKRAPELIRKLGLEWFWRLVLAPRKRIKRILNALVVFPIKAIFSSR
jgi:N-acetylglucosaminyldiphosphoundecaprenol N-acetyl-beta-D-mannosaminyltransferase